MPLAIHGVFTRADGSSVSFSVGEDENDPVFCITDLLPHLGAEQNDRKLSDGIKAEELNVLIGSDAVEEEDVKGGCQAEHPDPSAREVRHHRARLHPR